MRNSTNSDIGRGKPIGFSQLIVFLTLTGSCFALNRYQFATNRRWDRLTRTAEFGDIACSMSKDPYASSSATADGGHKPSGAASNELERFLRQALETGKHGPGQQLPTERAIATHFGVSRTAVRRILAELERQGLIYRKVGCGTFIADKFDQALIDDDTWRNTGPKQLMEARLSVEPVIARLFVENASPRDEERVKVCLKRSEASRSFEEFEQWDEAFHEAIVAGAHNPLMVQWYALVTTTRRQARWYGIKRRVYTKSYRETIEGQHRDILAALQERDADKAAELTQAHLRFIERGLFGALD